MVNKKIITILLSLVLLLSFAAFTFANVAPVSKGDTQLKVNSVKNGHFETAKIGQISSMQEKLAKKAALATQRGLTKEQVTNLANKRNAMKSHTELLVPVAEVPGGGDIFPVFDVSFETEDDFLLFDLVDLSTNAAGNDWMWLDYGALYGNPAYAIYNSAFAPEPGGDFGGDVAAKDEAIEVMIGIPKTSDAGVPYRVSTLDLSLYMGNPDPDDVLWVEINEPAKWHLDGELWLMQTNQYGAPGYHEAWIEDLVTEPIAIPAGTTTLSFDHLIISEAEWDGGNVKVSADGGATWTVIVPNEGYDIADLFSFKYHGAYLNGLTDADIDFEVPSAWDEPGFTNDHDGPLAPVTFDLSAFAGQTIQIKWEFTSDGYTNQPNGGWWVDNILVTNGATTVFENDGTAADNMTASRFGLGYGSSWEAVAGWAGYGGSSVDASIVLTENVIGAPGDSLGVRFRAVYDDNDEGTGSDPDWGFEVAHATLSVFTRFAEDIGVSFADLDSSFTKGEPIFAGHAYDPQLVVSNFGLTAFKIYNTFVKIINDFGTTVYERYIYTYAPQQGDSLYEYPDFQPFNDDMGFYNFPDWTPQYEGDYTLIAYTELFEPDDDISNDSLVVEFHVFDTNAAIHVNEDFNAMDDTQLYETWGSLGENGANAWFIGDLFGNGDTELWCFHSDATVFADTIIAPAFDCTGMTNTLVKYEQHVYADSDPTFVGGVVVSVDSGKTWTAVKTMTRTSPSAARHGFMTLNISAITDNQPHVLVGFFFNSQIAPPGAAGYQYFTVDDLLIYSGADIEATAGPATFTGVSGDMSAKLNWTAVTGAAYYTVWEGESDTLANANALADVNALTFTSEELVNDQAYYYWITVADFNNNISDPVGPIMVTPHDAVAPAAITDLEAHDLEGGAKVIMWSAPAESMPEEGSYYDIRYSYDPITAANWDDATTVLDTLAVADAGTEQMLEIEVTRPSYDVFFAIVTVDEAGNESAISNVALADDKGPGSVTDLKVVGVTETTVTLSWTAVGDDGELAGGAADHYEIRVDYEDFGGAFPNWDDAAVLTQVPTPGLPGSTEVYTAEDFVYPASTKMSFQMVVYDNNGAVSKFKSNVAVSEKFDDNPIGVKEEEKLPETFAMGQNYPNPFNPTTAISYQLPKAAHVKLTVFSATGQQIRTLVDGTMPAGFHNINWDAMDNAGHKVASGVYFYRLETAEFTSIKKMTLMK